MTMIILLNVDNRRFSSIIIVVLSCFVLLLFCVVTGTSKTNRWVVLSPFFNEFLIFLLRTTPSGAHDMTVMGVSLQGGYLA